MKNKKNNKKFIIRAKKSPVGPKERLILLLDQNLGQNLLLLLLLMVKVEKRGVKQLLLMLKMLRSMKV